MYKVLIVDDDSIICAGLQKLINWEEYGFITEDFALNGLEALKMVESNRYDLIITDVRMPKMDGIEFIKVLQQIRYPSKIIILSAYRDFEYAQTALELGVKKYILKPVNEKKFVETIIEIKNEIEEDHRQKQTVNESRTILKERVIADLLKESEANIQTYERAKDVNVDLDNKTFRVCIIEFCGMDKKDQNTFSHVIKKVMEELVHKYDTCYATRLGDTKIAALIGLNDKTAPLFKQKLDEIFLYIDGYTGNTANISVGNEVSNYTRIFESYNNACAALESGFFKEQRKILYFDELENQSALHVTVKYVKEHCCEKLSLQSIAARFFFNPAYLGRIFKTYTGLSFNDFLIECKMEQAVKLLESKKLKVGEIAEKVGYSDYDHFCRVFKAKKGCTPSEYKSSINCSTPSILKKV